nr:hypothetical protein CFP56_57855 [Quercus suber]
MGAFDFSHTKACDYFPAVHDLKPNHGIMSGCVLSTLASDLWSSRRHTPECTGCDRTKKPTSNRAND